MKKDGKYRFSLQFGADSEQQIQVGELLERLGNRKSAVVVAAVSEYMSGHPELAKDGCRRIYVSLEPQIRREAIEKLVRSIVEERLGGVCAVPSVAPEPTGTEPSTPETRSSPAPQSAEDDIARMISNLEVFDAAFE